MHGSFRATVLVGALFVGLSPLAAAGTAGQLHWNSAPRSGAVWEVELTSERALPAGALLLAARGRDVHVLGIAGPDGRFQIEVPAALELDGAALTVWAAASEFGRRWSTEAQEVTVAAGDGGYFDPSVDRFAITSCSLGCSGAGGLLSCGIVNTFVNPELSFTFSQPVDLSSVLQNPTSFRVLDIQTGLSPAAEILLEPRQPNTLIYRPEVSFDALGNPIFAFQSGAAYLIETSGTVSGFGPYILSVTGAPLATRLLCTVSANLGVQDYVPGPPTVVLDPAAGATGVPLDAEITMLFQDVMNLATLAIPATLQAPFITVLDGSGSPISGRFIPTVDFQAKTTTVLFDPDQDLPAGETIQVGLPPAILDLVGNPLANAGIITFTTVGP